MKCFLSICIYFSILKISLKIIITVIVSLIIWTPYSTILGKSRRKVPANAESSAKLKAHLKRQIEEEEKAKEEEAKKKNIVEEEAKKTEEEKKSGELISITHLNRLTIRFTWSFFYLFTPLLVY